MPNWCNNKMVVVGGKRDLQRFIKSITVSSPNGADSYEMNRLVPLDERATVSKTFTNTDKDGNETSTIFHAFATAEDDGFDGYGHAVERWGSKWGACSLTVQSVGEQLDIQYETAWSPADKLIMEISKQFPNLIFAVTSDEESRMFVVWSVFHNGSIVESEFTDTSNIPAHIVPLHDALDSPDASDTDFEEYYEAMSEWYGDIFVRCDTEAVQVANEYKKHLAYVKRCESKGVNPRDFVSSI